jgi:hypothetical protein
MIRNYDRRGYVEGAKRLFPSSSQILKKEEGTRAKMQICDGNLLSPSATKSY